MSPVPFRGPLGAVFTILAGIAAVAVTCYLILATVAARKATRVQRGWELSLGSYDEMLQRYPSSEANASALELERLSARLGIDTATRGYADRARPTNESAAELKRVKLALSGYLRRHVERPNRHLEPPPAAVASYLAAHRNDLDAVHRHLIEGEPPHWERQIEKLTAAPIPNLVGHIDLQKILLSDALANAQRGDRQRALAGFEASWRLNQAIRDEPMLMVQLMSVNGAHLHVGALRQIENVPSEWLERLFEHDFRESLVTALRYEGWMWTRLEEPLELADLPSIGKSLMSSVMKPYFRYCLSDMSEDYRERVENLDTVAGICDYDLSRWQADLDVRVPRWNVIGGILQPYLDGTLRRLARLELNRELTVKLLELEAVRRADDGRWPVSMPGIEVSSACPREHWVYEVSADGAMTLALDREVTWPDLKGARMPTRFTTSGG